MINNIVDVFLNWALPFICCAVCGWVVGVVRGYKKHLSAFTDGVKSLLRSEIIRNYEKYTDRGYCPIYAREPLSHVYEAYHALGGNSTATDLYKKTMALPSDPPSDPSEE